MLHAKHGQGSAGVSHFSWIWTAVRVKFSRPSLAGVFV